MVFNKSLIRIVPLLCLVFWMTKLNAQFTHQLDSMVGFDYDTVNGTLNKDYRYLMSYNSSLQNTYWIAQIYDFDSLKWYPGDSASYTYDANGRRIQEIYYEWDSDSNRYIIDSRTDYTYLTNGLPKGEFNFNYDYLLSQWDSSGYLLFTYNSSQELIEEAYFFRNSSASQWEGDELEEFFYDGNGRLIRSEEYRWNSTENNWDSLSSSKEEFMYNSGTGFLDTTYYFFRSGSNFSPPTYRSIYTHDVLGNPLINSGQNFLQSQGWVTTEEGVFIYDTSLSIPQVALPINYITDFQEGEEGQVSVSLSWVDYQYDFNLNRLYQSDSLAYYYSQVTLLNTDKPFVKENSELFKLFPNPASEKVTIRLNENSGPAVMSLYDQSGRLLLQINIDSESILPVRHLSSGLYFIELREAEKVDRKPLLIR